ncbi:MAG: Holliday junction branch migration DNA helicase RuvB [Candidatus Babeliaceae bacterium]|nr:Holliday junction branch migration DNA helicase RuvB [Candidatus Babeliaceae bacterium]
MDSEQKIDLDLTPIMLVETAEDQNSDFHPKTFDDYCGQTELKTKLKLYTDAARQRGEPLDHLLLFGPPGLGKTTLAQIMAAVMQVGIKICSGPTLERTGDLVSLLSSLESRDILFIDEIHRLPAPVEETLYSAMEQFRIDIIIGQGAGAKSVNLPINPFTLIGATTKAGMISAPLRSRFGITERIDFYTDGELTEIILQNVTHLGISIETEGAALLAHCSRGTPRIAKKLLRRIRDFAQINNNNHASSELIQKALLFLRIDHEGLNAVDHAIINTIINHFDGGPVGLETIASMIGEESATIEDVYEPFLMRKGYLEKTPRGRQIPRTKLSSLKHRFDGQKTIWDT